MRIVIIQGNPDHCARHYGHALAEAYADGAREAGHEVTTIEVAALTFPLLHNFNEFHQGETPAAIVECQELVRRAEHLVIIYPLWLGSMPALLKGFFEQLFRPGFAVQPLDGGQSWKKLLTGRSARVIVTMGMPALAYRWFFRAHSLKSLERNILKFTGINPVRESLIGMIEGRPAHRQRWLRKMARLGRAAR
ncbi:NAD(P)H-dependent oxidoreductase [Thiohalophilus thiocyanatoxydans]|uniref:Putative NADPH-quinone reductase n=1 Tax=Thiohalophilus thiocyanatoxydans TaxID=381308 RepID=A0A4V3H4A9_9GAMM|nr:NAD(P)H-dependent oxidoreductase [Thiohalophilus thiocyanatoxydans]TDY02525.1 putative NADPH-quinone reductase [Thiohalophilus thiocyanatoxydans]